MAADLADRYDVVVVGGGNAALCAAHAARESGASVAVLEKTARDEAGGNTYFTAGAFRLAHGGLDDLRPLLDDSDDPRLDVSDIPAYPADAFVADMERVTAGANDDAMTRVMADDSREVVGWMAGKGIRWELLYPRQTYRDGERWVFFGNLALGIVDGGKGLVAQHTEAALAAGIEIHYGVAVTDLLRDGDAVTEVEVVVDGVVRTVRAGAVVLAAGGFESDPEMRRKHLGDGWERAIVRGTPSNTGEVLRAALAHGAAAHGDWSSCHSVQWDAEAPPNGGERELTNSLTRQSYPVGIVVNGAGERFLDEGADFRNYTYAKYGREVLAQPGGRAVQIFDATTRPLLRTLEYDVEGVTEAVADSLPELAEQVGVDPEGLVRTVEEFNASIAEVGFNPAVKDGRSARSGSVVKSHWASPIAAPPFYGYPVACGITFTFGGIRIDPHSAAVLDEAGARIPGLFAAGEIAGGLFSGNYPGGSGLIAGSVFGRRAGRSAATG
ncbi:FAD-dependent tricarballylate dehydrogenase TcuA [Pseudonocardia nematodicida]|uniref:FAD-dependent tricarballylate dehydrogenase TcuA n=1 Tax=Pseudonocardia nematodicida TaxID=1206997 RepID=A0ABV1KFQ8_9PSEU